MQDLLQIDVTLDQVEKVQGAGGEVTMIRFHGVFVCGLGAGKVLPGGVDMQLHKKGIDKSLSARYILEGKDREGRPFRIFVENNGVCKEDGTITTKPIIYTDAVELQWMETEKLRGTVESLGENQVRIRINKE